MPVNAVRKTKRTVEEVTRRWQDLRCRTKEKLFHNKSSGIKTGSEKKGPAKKTLSLMLSSMSSYHSVKNRLVVLKDMTHLSLQQNQVGAQHKHPMYV